MATKRTFMESKTCANHLTNATLFCLTLIVILHENIKSIITNGFRVFCSYFLYRIIFFCVYDFQKFVIVITKSKFCWHVLLKLISLVIFFCCDDACSFTQALHKWNFQFGKNGSYDNATDIWTLHAR